MEHIEIISLLSIAFFASFGHCIGMCGGIVLAYSALYVPTQDSQATTTSHALQKPQTFLSSFIAQIPYHLLYHCGKTTTYAILGFLAGSLGYIAAPNNEIKYIIMLIVGAFLIIFGIAIAWLPKITHFFHTPLPFKSLSKIMRFLLTKGSVWRLYALGLCNGLLPCGIVYYFLLTAAVSGNGINGAIIMCLFGIAAAPALFALGLISAKIQHKRILFLRLGGLGMVGFGCYEIYKALRALGFISA
ncbi:sulfite exporter TauE/SafE family protein [Helicobacter sp. MIT 21-1697]|uniref:sulfite exporter TauE/SafE family protein n=1 Tax=Helicobacter sp. MIT 21-1697 TaxID=2993733 RepID=UPI00224AD9E9|nr:sulfite exporter TauE/SafE family protein [Helicobacter sp. MIT 21-1697]MCX2717624.1 sulfite exporter TauE/SafE family protein [Helicobacter sp. MIT 21-1697]